MQFKYKNFNEFLLFTGKRIGTCKPDVYRKDAPDSSSRLVIVGWQYRIGTHTARNTRGTVAHCEWTLPDVRARRLSYSYLRIRVICTNNRLVCACWRATKGANGYFLQLINVCNLCFSKLQ